MKVALVIFETTGYGVVNANGRREAVNIISTDGPMILDEHDMDYLKSEVRHAVKTGKNLIIYQAMNKRYKEIA